MAEDIGALVVRIETDLKNFNNGINQVGEKVNNLGSTIKKVGGLIAGAFAVKAVVGGIKDLTDAAKESERAANRLQTLAMNVPGTTQAQIDALKKLAGEIQNLTVIEDDAMIAGQSQLATFQLSTSTIAKLSPAFADLAVATYGANVSQEQMIQSGNLIGKVMMGNVGALSRVGVSFTAAQEEILKTGTEAQKTAALVEVLGQNFGGLAESTRSTTEGAIIAMNNAWGDMKEVLGGFLLPILGQMAAWFSSQIPVIQSTAESAFTKIGAAIKITSDAVNTLTNFFTTYWGVLQPILLGITAGAATFGLYTLAINAAAIATGIWTTVTGIATTVGAAFAAVLAFITSPIGIVVIAIAALVAAGVALYRNWDEVSYRGMQAWGTIKTFMLNAVDKMLGGIEKLTGWIPGFGEKIAKARAELAMMIAGEEITMAFRKYDRETGLSAIADQKAADATTEKAEALKDTVPAYNAAGMAASGFSGSAKDAADATKNVSEALSWQEFGLKRLEQGWQIVQSKYTDSTTEAQKLAGQHQYLNDKLFLVNESLTQAQKNLLYNTDNFAANSREVQDATLAVGNYQVQQAELQKQLKATNTAMKEQLESWQKLMARGNKEDVTSGAMLWAAEAAAGGRWEGFGEKAKWIPGTGNIKIEDGKFLPALARGTNFVPFDTAAFLHKGEAVIPAKNNPANGGSMGGVTVNVYANNVVGRNGMLELKDIISTGLAKDFGLAHGGAF